jgi:hypothetical protein
MKINRTELAAIALATPIPAMLHATPSGPTAQIGPICGPA